MCFICHVRQVANTRLLPACFTFSIKKEHGKRASRSLSRRVSFNSRIKHNNLEFLPWFPFFRQISPFYRRRAISRVIHELLTAAWLLWALSKKLAALLGATFSVSWILWLVKPQPAFNNVEIIFPVSFNLWHAIIGCFCLFAVSQYEGDSLNLIKVSRLEMGAYLCIASNGVPPTVSKRITVDVECKLWWQS